MSNANTPAMMAQSMAESLLRENRVLKEHNEHLVRETVKMAEDVAAIQRAHDEQKLRLYTEIRSLKALLTVQVQDFVAALEQIVREPQETMSDGKALRAIIKIAKRALTAIPQQVKSEDARDAARYRWLRRQNWYDAELCVVVRPKYAVKLGHDCPSTDRLDAAIDSAISAQD